MRRKDKSVAMLKANILFEQRNLKSKGLIKEEMNLPIQMEGEILSPQEEEVLNDIISDMDVLNEGSFSNILNKVKGYAKKGMLTAGILTALLATPGITNAQSDAIRDATNIENVQGNEITNENIKDAFFKTSGEDRSLVATIISQDMDLFELIKPPSDVVDAAGLNVHNFFISNYKGSSEQNAKFINFISQNKDLFDISDSGIKLKVKVLFNKSNSRDANHWYETRIDDSSAYFLGTSGNALIN